MKKIYLLSIIAFVVFISSCKKDNSIGASLLNQDDLLNAKFSDTFSVTTKTVEDTFLRSDKLYKNYLGVINDPMFGFQKASIVMELDRPSNIYDDTLMTGFIVDSVVLLLKYNYVYGDTLVPQSFTVSKINNKINEAQAYYATSTTDALFPARAALGNVSDYLFTPTRNPVSTTILDTAGVASIIRIKLDDQLGRDILSLGQTVLRDSTLFKNAFNGIRVENTTTNGNAMAEIDLSSTYTAVNIYYRDKYNIKKQSKLFPNLYRVVSGAISPQTNSINLFEKSLSTTVQNVINSGLQNDSINYFLGQGGTMIKVNLPTITNVGRAAINKAVLQITQILPNTASLATPFSTYIFLEKRDANGNIDYIPTAIAPYAEGRGVIDSVGIDGLGNKLVRYSFNISKYIQNISSGTEQNTELYLSTFYFPGTTGNSNLLNAYLQYYAPVRFAFAGANYSDVRYRTKLNLTYTLIK
jgi:hypothetical protein